MAVKETGSKPAGTAPPPAPVPAASVPAVPVPVVLLDVAPAEVVVEVPADRGVDEVVLLVALAGATVVVVVAAAPVVVDERVAVRCVVPPHAAPAKARAKVAPGTIKSLLCLTMR